MVHRLVRLALDRASSARRDERGAVLVFVAIVMTAMMGFAALVIDLGNARQQDRQAEAAADAAALAGAQKIEDFGGTFTGSTSQWQAVVGQVKLYAQHNFGVSAVSWQGCTDAHAFSFHPDVINNNTCISTDLGYWPAPTHGETSLTNRIRVVLPETVIPTGFGRVLGRDSLQVDAVSVSGVQRGLIRTVRGISGA